MSDNQANDRNIKEHSDWIILKNDYYNYLVYNFSTLESFHEFFRRSNSKVFLLKSIMVHYSTLWHARPATQKHKIWTLTKKNTWQVFK